MKPIPLEWRARTVPLAPRAVLVRSAAAQRLARQLLEWDDQRLAAVRACAGDGALVVLGEETSLPWVDGACYLGHDPAAPALLVPTNREPGVPLDLFDQALCTRLGRGPWAVIPQDGGLTAVPVGLAGPLSRHQLARWLTLSEEPR